MEESRENKAKHTSVKAALAVGFVCVVVGLPLWWKTTTVYRVQLPYTEIDQLSKIKLKVSVFINVLVSESQDAKSSLQFQDKLSQELEGMRLVDDTVWVEYKVFYKGLTVEQKSMLRVARNVHELDKLFESAQSAYSYDIVLLPHDTAFKSQASVVGRNKAAYVPHKPDAAASISSIVSLCKHVFVNEKALIRAVQAATGVKHQQSDKESMRKVRSHSGYQLTFTLLNPQPDMVDVRWNVPQAVSDYLTPLLNKFEDFIDLKVKSQYLHYLGIGTTPVKDEKTGDSYLRQADLPHIINPIEGYLASHVSTDPDLNFVVYVPTRNQSPTKILDSTGTPTQSNSFVIPRWGGFLVYNIPALADNASLPVITQLDMGVVMEVFAGQIRLLLGITTQDVHTGVEVTEPGSHVLSQWELDFWLRTHCMENVATTILTLSSLTDLVEKINNMVINDHIGRQVEKAVSHVQKATQLLSTGSLREAYVASRQALTASESAFFDQSLLELLYFPEDQKFAIYIPLFLPIGIPIIMSVFQAVKYFVKKPEKSKTE